GRAPLRPTLLPGTPPTQGSASPWGPFLQERQSLGTRGKRSPTGQRGFRMVAHTSNSSAPDSEPSLALRALCVTFRRDCYDLASVLAHQRCLRRLLALSD